MEEQMESNEDRIKELETTKAELVVALLKCHDYASFAAHDDEESARKALDNIWSAARAAIDKATK